jgi:hypothetical protein
MEQLCLEMWYILKKSLCLWIDEHSRSNVKQKFYAGRLVVGRQHFRVGQFEDVGAFGHFVVFFRILDHSVSEFIIV